MRLTYQSSDLTIIKTNLRVMGNHFFSRDFFKDFIEFKEGAEDHREELMAMK